VQCNTRHGERASVIVLSPWLACLIGLARHLFIAGGCATFAPFNSLACCISGCIRPTRKQRLRIKERRSRASDVTHKIQSVASHKASDLALSCHLRARPVGLLGNSLGLWEGKKWPAVMTVYVLSFAGFAKSREPLTYVSIFVRGRERGRQRSVRNTLPVGWAKAWPVDSSEQLHR
jgi:hypothetical protein